jgi:hypothetical protein
MPILAAGVGSGPPFSLVADAHSRVLALRRWQRRSKMSALGLAVGLAARSSGTPIERGAMGVVPYPRCFASLMNAIISGGEWSVFCSH